MVLDSPVILGVVHSLRLCGTGILILFTDLVQEWQVCQVTVGVLGDVCRAIEDQIAPYTENIMRILLRNLESNDVQRNIKPQILSAFGDMSLAIGDRFEVCLAPCLHMLQSAQVRHTSAPRLYCILKLLHAMHARLLCTRCQVSGPCHEAELSMSAMVA